ncbi:PREDICTED: RING-H2 finger protein ATL77-like [Nicotiana attenuata]|uniref:Ring-h2 finger protein atl13 n=1 Tax=Nicotiana attenuata TaxID=49451 RepID=A0A314KHB1_NICAT|nr:PREDICTED: RING-H2 finger protein ATL77-like [Nicotiana attenuata]OIT28715.1 ring-h2 finger protein atl13 [Nicotiana attenuata]
MVMEIVVSVVLLLVGIAVLVFIHVCIVGRAFRSRNGITGVIFNPRNVNKSMSQDDIKKLPCFDYKVEIKGSSSPVDCAVCLENFKVGEKCRILPKCNHSFHAQCIDSWLQKTAACPICRACAKSPLKTEEESNNSSEVGIEMT